MPARDREAATSAGKLSSSQASARSTSGERPMPGTANSYQSLSQPKWRRSAVSPGGSTSARNPNVLSALGIACSLAMHLDGGVLQFALLLRCGIGEPVVAERVGHHVGRHDAVDVIHQEERGAQHLAGVLQPAHARHRDVGEFAGQPHHLELVVQPVPRKHRDVGLGGRDPRHPLLFPGVAVLGPAAGENDGLRRHSVGVDAAFHRDVGGDAARHDGGQPLRQHRGQGGDVPARALQVGRHLSTAGSLATGSSFTTELRYGG